jgi:small-conductance mechanosensitive channel
MKLAESGEKKWNIPLLCRTLTDKKRESHHPYMAGRWSLHTNSDSIFLLFKYLSSQSPRILVTINGNQSIAWKFNMKTPTMIFIRFWLERQKPIFQSKYSSIHSSLHFYNKKDRKRQGIQLPAFSLMTLSKIIA